MIGEGPHLIEALPGALQEALGGALAPDEPLLLSVRGLPRHALAATQRRLLRLEEPTLGRVTSLDVRCDSFPWQAVRNLRLEEAPAGARLRWETQDATDGKPTEHQFEIPTYDLAKFRRVLDRLQKLAAQPTAAAGETGAPEPHVVTAVPVRTCPKCTAVIPDDGAWCPACGLQVADVCWQCGGVLATQWSFCPRCGMGASEPGTVPCPSCREPVARNFAYCPRCGTAARPLCYECGRALRRDWSFCPECGTPVEEDEETRRQVGEVSEGVRTPPPVAAPSRPGVTHPKAEAFNEEGKRHYEADNLDAAIAAFRRAVALDPTNADYQTNLAVALDEKELDFEAFAAYQRALELNPHQTTALLNLGYLYSESERYEEARQVWEQVIRIDPASEEAEEARRNLQNLDEL